ncbi:toll/interleukin-1 receptor domain-containing protein [Mesorhizobium sp. M7A.F.Ca.US.010.02.1.1]|uniref:toll/interleukin-1 receptor domain-containing protein n=1 Tax=Mesorhizobium sp. M7A.F.Ca.US.010.02.1.1 TaxID=2496743 RepID=UPI000FD61178|nr:toll/interleukin-1 receptor domain-containing protein [Mesorhizobium sp. M7A.F.Ca.US.010.02.1.1]RUW90241.1 toll/interleukin-1 receptor domain-containing protein [Mesorhizobium sp. M7A.F.Ca.US.010.02.1.1]
MLNVTEKPDVFISHASPDKATFVRPLAEALRKLGVAVWYDEFSLELGDSISQQIDRGIANSRFGIVVVSPAFISRNWTQHELHALVNRDVDQDIRILPVWHGVTKKEVSDFSPSLADKVAIDTSHVDAMEAAIRILRTIRPDLYSAHPRAELERLASGAAIAELQAEIEGLHAELEEYRCPYCGVGLSTRADAPMDDEQKNWDVVEVFDCGFRHFGGSVDRPCPQDPRFPKFDDYEVVILSKQLSGAEGVTAMARPKTDMARKLRLNAGVGATEQEARARLLAQYRYAAGEISNAEWFKATVG